MNLRTKLEPILPFTVGHSHRQATYTRVAWKPNKFVVNAVNHVAPHSLSFHGGTASSNPFHSASSRLPPSGAACNSSFDATAISPSLKVAGASRHSAIPSLQM